MTDTLRVLAEKARDTRIAFEDRRPGGFKSAFNYDDYRKATRLFRAAATPEAIIGLLDRIEALEGALKAISISTDYDGAALRYLARAALAATRK